MTIKGITEKEESIIKSIIEPFSEYEFYFYGSRVKGNFRPLSDLDLMIKGEKEIPLDILNRIKADFDSSLLPYIVNVVDYYTLSEKFYSIIKDDLVRAV